jgi:hypothetical protein
MRMIPVEHIVPPQARAAEGAQVTDLRGRPVLTADDEETIMGMAGHSPADRRAFAVCYLAAAVGDVLQLLEQTAHPALTEHPTVAQLRRAAVVADVIGR